MRTTFNDARESEETIEHVEVDVKRYGFRLRPGHDDQVFAELKVELSINNGKKHILSYPQTSDLAHISTVSLEQIKQDGKLIIAAFEQSLSLLAKTGFETAVTK